MSIERKSSVLWGIVFYIDIRDFTFMTSALGSEDTLTQVGYFYEIVDEIVEKFDGWVNNKMGDGVLCFFGFGIDDSILGKENAIKAALVIQSRLAYSPKIKFSAGIGISSGEIANNNGVFIGEPINLAARLSSIASGGQVYVCEQAIPPFAGGYEVSDSIPIIIKGLKQEKLIFSISAKNSCLLQKKTLVEGLNYG